MKNKIYYEVEEFDDGSFQISSDEKAKELFDNGIRNGDKLKKFIELK